MRNGNVIADFVVRFLSNFAGISAPKLKLRCKYFTAVKKYNKLLLNCLNKRADCANQYEPPYTSPQLWFTTEEISCFYTFATYRRCKILKNFTFSSTLA